MFEVDYRKVAVRRVRRLHSVHDAALSTHGVDGKPPPPATVSSGRLLHSLLLVPQSCDTFY